jgi:hypothetical protein
MQSPADRTNDDGQLGRRRDRVDTQAADGEPAVRRRHSQLAYSTTIPTPLTGRTDDARDTFVVAVVIDRDCGDEPPPPSSTRDARLLAAAMSVGGAERRGTKGFIQ